MYIHRRAPNDDAVNFARRACQVSSQGVETVQLVHTFNNIHWINGFWRIHGRIMFVCRLFNFRRSHGTRRGLCDCISYTWSHVFDMHTAYIHSKFTLKWLRLLSFIRNYIITYRKIYINFITTVLYSVIVVKVPLIYLRRLDNYPNLQSC